MKIKLTNSRFALSKMRLNFQGSGALLFFSIYFLGCGGGTPIPENKWVSSVSSKVLEIKPSVSALNRFSNSVEVVVNVNKDLLLNQRFFYGADLQYSSQYSKQYNLYNQSIAVGHIPAFFRVAGDELQLIGDMTYRYPSDVNHPEQLLTRFKIIFQNENNMTISGANSEATLVQMITGQAGQKPADTWIRSLAFSSSGGYFLQETSVLLADGTILEFMESIFPASNLQVSDSFKASMLKIDPADIVGAESGSVSRYRFLRGETMFQGEQEIAWAQRFDITLGTDGVEKTIDWYVTENIPEEYLMPVGAAVEGWNRYFKNFKGIEREVVKFKGRLPKGIHLGDPRYNVINWDSRLVAGAAYESQASDPFTGKQSHSLIYMPAAWLQIGKEYWKRGQYSDFVTGPKWDGFDVPLSSNGFWVAGGKVGAAVTCERDLNGVAQMLFTSGKMEESELHQFAVELLKGVLFHEVGHALGLGHNFKGSLSFDRNDILSPFSTSIMDYNEYELERAAFNKIDSWDGPLLEYDRRALSALYNGEADVDLNQDVLPACNDEEADLEKGGVDPLCLRYDLERDPTLSVETAWSRIVLEKKVDDVTLAQALMKVPEMFLTPGTLEAVKTKDDLLSLVQENIARVRGAVGYYLFYSPASLARSIRTNLESLLVFQSHVVPAQYDISQMRRRVLEGVRNAINLQGLPTHLTDMWLINSKERTIQKIQLTPYVQGLTPELRQELLVDLDLKIQKNYQELGKISKDGVGRLRAVIIGQLKHHVDVPYFFGRLEDGTSSLDIESSFNELLLKVILGNDLYNTQERVLAATSLVTFSGRMRADAAIRVAVEKLQIERMFASDNQSREAAEDILKVLLQRSM